MDNKRLENIKNYFQQTDHSVNGLRKVMLLIIFFCLLVVMGSIGSLFYFYSLATSNIYVMDKGGNIATAFKQDIEGQKEVEIDNHIRMIYNSFFSYTSNDYKNQIDKGLNLMGEKGRLLYQTYQSNGWFNSVVQNNLVVYATVDSIKVDAHSNPYYFQAYGKQFIRRFNVVEVRQLNTKGELFNVSRAMQKNPHGLEASLTITDNRTIKSDSIIGRTPQETTN